MSENTTEADWARIAGAKTHKEAYPGQYAHPLVGKRVTVRNAPDLSIVGAVGIVTRVIDSRFGQLVQLDSDSKSFYAIRHCKEEQ